MFLSLSLQPMAFWSSECPHWPGHTWAEARHWKSDVVLLRYRESNAIADCFGVPWMGHPERHPEGPVVQARSAWDAPAVPAVQLSLF